ncbi:MAG: hypothetical protein Q7T61_18380 [Caulobacter sp.]|nr:hypothetical protein [Caulobacter sp.]
MGRVSYGLVWAYAVAALAVWPVVRFSTLISEAGQQYLGWIGWGALILGFVTLVLDGPCRAAIMATNSAFQTGSFPWPPRWKIRFLDIFSPRMGGVGLGVLRSIGLLEFIVSLALNPRYEPPLPATQIAICAVGVSTMLAIRSVAGPVFAPAPVPEA